MAAARARESARGGGPRFIDLTVSNPTRAGFPYDEQAILSALTDPRALTYAPESLGLREAREAVARDWTTATKVPVDAAHVALTASTSEAYAVLFKALADPGDQILVPEPSYPLLDMLAQFEAVELVPYPLVYAGEWHIDLPRLRASVTDRTRAIVVVSPNNPTGSRLRRHELDAMLDLDVPLISDEVFARYPLRQAEDRVDTVLEARRGLVFALSGLSKLVALPQLKLGWIGVAGEPAQVDHAMTRLELVLDAYLSVNAPVQYGASRLLAAGTATRSAIASRTAENLEALKKILARAPSASVLDAEAGWYAMVRVPEIRDDEAWTLSLAHEQRVYVHPGYFFDMHRGAHLVISLLARPEDLVEGAERIADHLALACACD